MCLLNRIGYVCRSTTQCKQLLLSIYERALPVPPLSVPKPRLLASHDHLRTWPTLHCTTDTWTSA